MIGNVPILYRLAIATLNERRQSTTNPYSLLNQKIDSACRELDKIKQEKIEKQLN